MIRRRRFAVFIAVPLLLLGTAFAGPFEDGQKALKRGDMTAAAKAFATGAKQGDPKAMGALGTFYAYGIVLPQDYDRAASLLGPAAKAGDPVAQVEMANLYRDGHGVGRNLVEAIRLYAAAAVKGNDRAQFELGELNHNGAGVPKDLPKAFEWFTLAAKNGNAAAQYSLGYMYQEGEAIPRDHARAAEWYGLSARQGNVSALIGLGSLYRKGRGVPQDFQQALLLYRMAAVRGHGLAQGMLGEMYLNGEGLEKDYAKAYVWFNIASADAAYSAAVAQDRDRAAGHLTPGELSSAQSLTRQCLASSLLRCGLVDASDLPRAKESDRDDDSNGDRARIAVDSGKPRLFATGSGFYVSAEGHIVTNEHVVADCREIRSATSGAIARIAADKTADLALLKAANKPKSFARLHAGSSGMVGETIVAVGYPLHGLLSSEPIVTTGTISALAGMQNDKSRIQISAPVQPGNSGGPVLGENGSVVGVVVGKLNAARLASVIGDIAQNINFAVSLSTLQVFLKAHGVAYVTETSTQSRRPAEIAAAASAYAVSLECWK